MSELKKRSIVPPSYLERDATATLRAVRHHKYAYVGDHHGHRISCKQYIDHWSSLINISHSIELENKYPFTLPVR